MATVLGSFGAAAGCSDSSSNDATLHVDNQSDFSITDIRVTPTGTASWGGNLIDGDVLAPGESLTLGVNCDTYDAMLIDSTGVTCTLNDVNLCLNNADWVIRNDTCSVFSAARAAREAAAKANPGGSATR